MTITVVHKCDVALKHRGGPPGSAVVGRAIDSAISMSMGAGFGHFDGCAIEWTLLYDEIVYVISGTFIVETDGHAHEAGAGDVMWIPEGTTVTYGGRDAQIFYAVQPGNWAQSQS